MKAKIRKIFSFLGVAKNTQERRSKGISHIVQKKSKKKAIWNGVPWSIFATLKMKWLLQ